MKLFIALTAEDIESMKNGDIIESLPPSGCTYDSIESVNILTEGRLEEIKEAIMFPEPIEKR